VNWSAADVGEVPYPKTGFLTLSLGLLGSVATTPDWTVTWTVPEPFGTTAVTCESSTNVTDVAEALPKNTERRPAAPEKFWPVIVTVLPAAPLLALRPVTLGVRSTTSKSAAVSAAKPRTSFMFQVKLMALLAFCEAELPVTYIALPMSARTRPYCCMAWAMIWASGPKPLMTALTAGVFMRRKCAPKGSLVDPAESLTTCEAG